ncbi:hypothetical protein EDD16DRAFT_1519678 [Pisolithus croceorrhizus]|nr:hypothetical protein EDD16DRAFT_1519678 [Pisolithus croceorrhizus]
MVILDIPTSSVLLLFTLTASAHSLCSSLPSFLPPSHPSPHLISQQMLLKFPLMQLPVPQQLSYTVTHPFPPLSPNSITCSSLTPKHFTLDTPRVSLVPCALCPAVPGTHLPLPSSPNRVSLAPSALQYWTLTSPCPHLPTDIPSPSCPVPKQVRFSIKNFSIAHSTLPPKYFTPDAPSPLCPVPQQVRLSLKNFSITHSSLPANYFTLDTPSPSHPVPQQHQPLTSTNPLSPNR